MLNEPIVFWGLKVENISNLKRLFEVSAPYLKNIAFTVFTAKILCIIFAERQHISTEILSQ